MTSNSKQKLITPVIQQIQHPKKEQFIELYRTTHGHISDTARAVQIDRTTFYNWMKDDELFRTAILESDDELNDEMRQALIDKAGDGDLGAIIFYLRKRHPDFKDNYNIQANTQINIELPSWAKDEI